MDRATVDAYEAGAQAYRDSRTGRPEEAAAFARRLPPGAVRADLGCGPGLDASHLGAPLVVLDAAAAMVALVPTGLRVRGDLAALPFRRGALAGAWSSKAYQHLPHEHLPLALADLHRSLAPDAPVRIGVFAGDGAWTDDEELPGRRFSWWAPDRFVEVVTGAGFDVESVRRDPNPYNDHLTVVATRARRLPDLVRPGLRLLVCGLNPSLYAADAGVNYARPGNRFWPAALAAGVVTVDRDPWHALRHHGVGFTDLVGRATVAAAELRPEEFRAGLDRLDRLCRWLSPGALCVVGLTGWRAATGDRRAVAGWQERRVGGRAVYVMPNPSGLNAHSQVPDLAAHLRAAAEGRPDDGAGGRLPPG